MAKRKYSGKRNKMQPSAQTMWFSIPTSTEGIGSGGTTYIDLSQCASLINRRFYRQGINWAVGGFKLLSGGGGTGPVFISKLPNTWSLANSWEKSMRVWTKMNNEALAETESVRPRFLDFKIYADADHHSIGYGGNALPTGHAPGEWIASKAVVPFGPASPGNTAEFEFIAVGQSYPGAGASGNNAVSLIEGYAASRGLPYQTDPNTPADADDTDGSTPENWMAAVFNEGTDQTSEVIEDMIFENNVAPYPFEGDGVNPDTMYPGGANNASFLQLHDGEFVTSTTIGATTRLKGGNFPCGLIRIDCNNWTQSTVLTLLVDLVPGTHRGYLCEPMTEM